MKLRQQKVQNINLVITNLERRSRSMQEKENQRIPVRAAQERRLQAPEQRQVKSEKLAAEF